MNAPKLVDFDEMVKNGTISQETRDSIRTYMENNKPEAPAQGQAPVAGEQPDLLSDLLNAGIITQAEYDAMK